MAFQFEDEWKKRRQALSRPGGLDPAMHYAQKPYVQAFTDGGGQTGVSYNSTYPSPYPFSGDFHTTPKTANAEMTAEDYEDLRLAFAEYVSGGLHGGGIGMQYSPQYAMGVENAAGTPFVYPALHGFHQPQNTDGQAMDTLAVFDKKQSDQKVSDEDPAAEILSLMPYGLPNVNDIFGNTSKELAALRARQNLVDYYNALSPENQTLWIDLIKKYRSKWLTEDDLNKLNELNPGFMPDLPMPVYTGQTISAPSGDAAALGAFGTQAGEQVDKEWTDKQRKDAANALYGKDPDGNSIAYMNRQEQYKARIQAAATIPEIDALIEELEKADPFLEYIRNTMGMPRLMDPPHHWSTALLYSARERKSDLMEGNRILYTNPYEVLDENTVTGMDDLLIRRNDAVERLYGIYKGQIDPSVPEVVIRSVFDLNIAPLLLTGDLDTLDEILGPQYNAFKAEARSALEGIYQDMDLIWAKRDILTSGMDMERQSTRFGFEKTESEKIMDELLEYNRSGGTYTPSFMNASGPDLDAAGMEIQTPEQVAGQLLGNISAQKQKRLDDLIATEPTPGTKEHEEWKYQLDAAKYEFGQAQAQILMIQKGFWAKSAEGAKLQENPVEDGAWLVETLRAYGVAEKDIERIREQGFTDYTDWGEGEKLKHRIDFGIDGVPDDVIRRISAMPSGYTGILPNPYSPFALAHVMTPSEKGVWNWHLAIGDQEGANAYFKLIQESLYYRDEQVRQVAREGVNSTLGTLESIPGKPIASIKATLGTFINWIQGKETSGYNPDYAMLRDYEYYRDDVREMLPENVRPLFDTGMDLMDMLAAYTMTGGAAGMNLILANNDAASTIMETLENGGTIGEAMDKGIMTMAIQVASQYAQLGTKAGNAFLSPEQFKGAASDFLRGAFGNAVENMPAELYLNSKQRYDDVFVDYYQIELEALQKKANIGVSQEDMEHEAAMKAQRQAQQDALAFGLQDLFSTVVTGGLAPD